MARALSERDTEFEIFDGFVAAHKFVIERRSAAANVGAIVLDKFVAVSAVPGAHHPPYPAAQIFCESGKVITAIRIVVEGSDYLVKALISQVQKNPRGPQILLSRTSPRFLSRLLELEVPEIAAGPIKVKDSARQTGERAKVAVYSEDRDIDPVGACIGVKGNRILSILKELDG